MTLPDYEIQVSGDGGTCWVHYNDGSTIGRFSKIFGVDCHSSMTDQMAGKSQCMWCTHEPPGKTEWDRFRAVMLESYSVVVPENLMTF